MIEEGELIIEGTELYEQILDNTFKILALEGGSSSSKTVSFAQAHITWSFEEVNKTYSVVRKTLPALRRGALKDFNDALAWAECEDCFTWSERDMAWTNNQTGTKIEFFSLDNPQKARGPRRDRLWCNEANELSLEDWKQLAKRTRGKISIDYNPSMQRHWIYDQVHTRADCKVNRSTYLQNPFLTEDNIREIEVDIPVYILPDGTRVEDRLLTHQEARKAAGLPLGTLISGDPYHWAVFGLGLRGAPGEAIYPALYDSAGLTPGRSRKLGLDFGFNHATVLLDLEYRDKPGKAELHIDELIHQSYLTSDDILELLPKVGVLKRDEIEADGARPEMIEDIKRAGYNIKAADKGPGSVKAGIDKLKTVKLCFTARSKKSRDQFQDYRWKKTSSGEVLDEPIKLEDDAPDACRYGATSLIKTRTAPRRRYASSSIVR